MFRCVPKSLLPTSITKKRPKFKVLSCDKKVDVDELEKFKKINQMESFNAEEWVKCLSKICFKKHIISFVNESRNVILQSTSFISGVPLF